MSDGVVFVDTETLGLHPDLHPIWEVGVILPDGSEREWQIGHTDRVIGLADPKALEISGFRDRYDSRLAVTQRELCEELQHVLPEGCHLAGAVVSFDEERLRRLMWRWGAEPRWHYHLLDVEVLAAGWLRGQNRTLPPLPWSSDELSRACGVEPPGVGERHTALGDARWAKRLYERVFA